MTTDRTTKALLAVIAAALVALVAQNAARPAVAQPGVQRVVLCDPQAVNVCANVRGNGTVSFLLTAEPVR